MQPLNQLGYTLLHTLPDHLRPLIAYHLLFTLLASALVVPLIAWISRALLAQLNRTVVTNDALITLLFSPLGFSCVVRGSWLCILTDLLATSRHAAGGRQT